MQLFFFAVFAFFAPLASAAFASAQEQPPPPRFRTGVEVVQLDVTVLDRTRTPVRGLTAADFTILEDGRPQTIVAFHEIDLPDPETPPVAWMRDVPWDIRRNDDGANRRVMMLVIDDGQMRDLRTATTAREIARRLVERLGPGDLAGVVFTMDNRHAQDLTSDRRRLLETVDRTGPGELAPFLGQRYMSGVVARAAESLAQIPDRRKVLIYIGAGLRLDPASPAIAGSLGPTGRSGDPQGDVSYMNDISRRIVANARRGNVSIYTFNPRGLLPGEPGAGPTLADDDFARTIASGTGGTATVNTNTFDGRIDQLFRENRSYYVVGFEPTNMANDGKYRRLDVRVNRPGVMVQARGGYDAPRASDKTPAPRSTGAATASKPLLSAVSGLLPEDDLSMQVSIAPFAIPGKREAAVAIVVGVRQPPPQDRTERVEVLAAAFGSEGQMRASQRQAVQLTLRPTVAPTQYEVFSRLDLKPGQYHIRVAATTTTYGKSGSVYHEVTVPDFSKEPLSLSGLMLQATPAIMTAAPGVLRPLVPLTPTSQRVFERSARVTAFLRVYLGEKGSGAATMTARIVDGRGAQVFDATQVLGPERFGSQRAADYRIELPMSRLSGGSYLLTVEAARAQGEPVRRDVRFVVK